MRQLSGRTGIAVSIWAGSAAVFHLYTSGFGFFGPLEQRSLFLTWFLPLAFLLFPARDSSPKDRPTVPDIIFALLSVLPNLYVLFEAPRIYLRIENVDPLLPMEWVFGIMIIVLLLEAVRRAVTPALMMVAAIMIAYLFVTEYAPGMLYFRDLGSELVVETMYLVGGQGVYGFVTGVAATMVAIFIIFGAFMDGSGTGRLFSNIGAVIAGRYSGGPAKVAVVSSALMGTMSGSSSANVFTTGTFTIPMMKRLGYKGTFAGGVETSASVGGQIMPPIMGAAAFIMVEITQIPYTTIIAGASLGAICYFYMVLVTVHFEAGKLGLKGMPREDIPTGRDILKDCHLLIPIVVLVSMLIMRFSPHYSAFWSIVATVIVSWFRKETRITPAKFLEILANGGRSIIPVALACVCANIVIAGLTVTGLSVSIGGMIMAVASGNLIYAGVLLMFCTLLLGMGVPTSAAYVITSAIGAPILIQLGIEMLPAHLFVMYFAVLADATPPVSVASYAAASIARSHPIWTGAQAFRLALAGFVVGFYYLYSPALTLEGTTFEIISEFILLLVSLTLMAAATTGYLKGHIALPIRMIILIAVLAVVFNHVVPVPLRILGMIAVILALYFSPSLFGRKIVASTETKSPSKIAH